MYLKMTFLFMVLLMVNISCKNHRKTNELATAEHNDTLKREVKATKMETTKLDTIKIIQQLQGKWKEIEYPFRTAEFVSSTVQFIEEGTEGSLKFEKYAISNDCPFENNNVRDLKSGDVILVLPEATRCEKLIVSGDTLTLSGYSTNSNGDYNIIYLRSK